MAIENSEKEAMKNAIKEALAEELQEHRQFFHDLFAEVLEDFAMADAIREGQQTERISRKEVTDILDRKPE